eukprot:TRINITY_DN5285_c0_g1_i1.p1 TRINITY_DN5285_c0_g1~~TRINITY_DN5285_c0_g1_i1.p1  ORF type:complete len:236 (-),score=31.63 TRINITY_DN5285_c0_g1_i1:124-831(-)
MSSIAVQIRSHSIHRICFGTLVAKLPQKPWRDLEGYSQTVYARVAPDFSCIILEHPASRSTIEQYSLSDLVKLEYGVAQKLSPSYQPWLMLTLIFTDSRYLNLHFNYKAEILAWHFGLQMILERNRVSSVGLSVGRFLWRFHRLKLLYKASRQKLSLMTWMVAQSRVSDKKKKKKAAAAANLALEATEQKQAETTPQSSEPIQVQQLLQQLEAKSQSEQALLRKIQELEAMLKHQ